MQPENTQMGRKIHALREGRNKTPFAEENRKEETEL
jgi:hypothetical protein